MLFSRGLRCFALMTLWASAASLISQNACSQTAPVAQTQQADGTAASNPGRKWVKDLPAYEAFFKYVCIEDHLIRKHSKTENGLPLSRTDYSSAIGISESDEQIMLNIIFDSCRSNDENEKQYQESGDLISNYSRYMQIHYNIVYETWAKLQQNLEPVELKNLDSYVMQNLVKFVRGPDQPDSRRKSIAYEFQTFIQDVNDRDIENQRLIASGQKPQEWDYSREAHFPEEKEQAVLAIVLDAGRQLGENDRKIEEGFAAWQKRTPCANKPLNLSCPVPPELRAVEANGVSIVMETVSRLRLELGEESFDNLDKWISQEWWEGR